jgi:predicted metal-dependent phosphoesterase TrpH
VARVREIAEKLSALGMPIDVESVLLAAAARPGSSVGRPQVARELVRAGYVTSVQDAFDKWLATGRPAFMHRTGPSPAAIVDTIHDAGGVASMAHPAVTKRDELIAPLVERGLDAIEVYHSDHSPEATQLYKGMAQRLGTLVSGGSDFHGEDPTLQTSRTRRGTLGVVALPPNAFAALEERAASIRLKADTTGSGL